MSPTWKAPLRALVPFVGFVLILIIPYTASAQSKPPDQQAHWGIGFSVTPSWEITDQLTNLFDLDEGDSVNLTGTEFTIGILRGSTRGGDWGVSYVRKPFDDGSGGVDVGEDCFTATVCRPTTETTVTQDVVYNGVEAHKFMAFLKKPRVQAGLNIAGGVGKPSGTIITITDRFEPTGFNQQGPTGFKPVHEEESSPAEEELFAYMPFFKLEGEADIVLAPGLKVKIAGGFNFPAYAFRVGAAYRFGAK